MVDLDYAYQAFKTYQSKYPNTERINLKTAHMIRVMKNSMQLASALNLSSEDVKLAGLIGLIHDIGRFEQVRIYDTFIDSQSINHAMFSSEQLFKHGLIRAFLQDSSYDYIIKSAIENHNKFEIAQCRDSRELLHCKIIRDADKADIYVQVLESDPTLVFDGEYSITDTVNEKVFRDFKQHKCIKNEDMHTKLDDYIRKVALIYGLYFPETLKMIADSNLIDRLTTFFKQSFEFLDPTVSQTIDLTNSLADSYIKEKLRTLDKEEEFR